MAHLQQSGVEHRAAHVVEVDVDIIRKSPLQRGADVSLGLVVEGVVVAELGF
jgi:hypothetical protein